MDDPIAAYSGLDRLLHRIAFASPAIQRLAAEIEDAALSRRWASVGAGPPIFVTGVPRAGTTILLEALTRLPECASHTYRDMPFLMAPVLWSRLSGGFQRRADPRERAHGDGLAVGYDSPEAFEEVIWRAFWPEKYAETGIALWTGADRNAEAESFLDAHFRKIVALRLAPNAEAGRYVSKNNANIARLDLIPEMCPEARIVVPIRAPLAQAASLLRQHRNFLERHRQSGFARRYMRDLGHLEFGDLHRPIRFPGFDRLADGLDPESLDYWLAYWIAAYEHIAERRERVVIVAYEHLIADGPGTIRRLAGVLDLEIGGRAEEIGALFRSPPFQAPPDHTDALRARAEALYADLTGCTVLDGREAEADE